MEKKLKIRIIIATIAVLAAVLVILFSSGAFGFIVNGAKFVTADGRYSAKIFYYTKEYTLKEKEITASPFGTVSISSVKSDDNGVIAEFLFEGDWGLSRGKTLSARPVFNAARDYIMTVKACDSEFSFVSQTVSRSSVTAIYRLENANIEEYKSADFTLSNVVVNDYERK